MKILFLIIRIIFAPLIIPVTFMSCALYHGTYLCPGATCDGERMFKESMKEYFSL